MTLSVFFLFRALWFARNLDTALPSFEQDGAVVAANPTTFRGRGM